MVVEHCTGEPGEALETLFLEVVEHMVNQHPLDMLLFF